MNGEKSFASRETRFVNEHNNSLASMHVCIYTYVLPLPTTLLVQAEHLS
jgi:hypothetical protein